MILYAANRTVDRKLRSINKLNITGRNPVIQMTFMELDITNHTMKEFGEEIQVTSVGNCSSFLVKDIQLTEKDKSLY